LKGFGGNSPKKDVDNEGLYKLLDVDKNATPGQIKKAFYKFAKKNHPDKGGDAKKVDFIIEFACLDFNIPQSFKQ